MLVYSRAWYPHIAIVKRSPISSPNTISAARLQPPGPITGKTGIVREFNQWAPTYDRGRLAGWYQAQGLIALSHLRVADGARVLDIGCATGWALRQLVRRASTLTALGVDISDGMIATARDLARDEALSNLDFRVMDWEDDQSLLPEGKFDAILCISTFHYFADPLAALRKMRAALADHGQILIFERAMDGSLLARIWNAAHRWLIRDHVSFASSSRLLALAHEAGFADIRVATRLNRMFWKNKIHTSLVLIEASKPGESTDAHRS